MDFSEKWGKDVDEAVRLALIDLKLTEDQVKVIVLEEPTKGFLGLGAKLAKVRVEKKPELLKAEEKRTEEKRTEERKTDDRRPPEKSTEKPSFNKQDRGPKRDQERRPERRDWDRDRDRRNDRGDHRDDNSRQAGETVSYEGTFSVREKPADLAVLDNHIAESFLNEITEKMGLKLKITVQGNDSSIYVEMDGRDSGTIIGKRGQTLDAIQYLTSLVVNKDKEKYMRVVVDAENYREKREKTLEQLAHRLADKVVKSRKSVRLEPMNPYERKVIHATLQSNPRVTTRSEGEEPYRRVIIELK
ncbi:MAG TPA: RNA-binding cell elongation regulator Jag/EloR [Anaerovoracaceae bacterium]|nr:RNA-binding cell elongation regulator Jag/EloR [Anaerovoracaceae bacterium]